ncbi:protein C12orf4 homolog [Ruditapes philippinarum]|uniref:protein C12orf4 homolog n=1 Tax=Ruditapes philippinarum TaxID=129788 RepID=UPI00295B8CFD|nr:protein C12orf4 homolog [Ruditapes philippinarum]
MPLSIEREFVYTFASKDVESVLRVPVTIPYSQPARDLTGRLVFEHNLPCYIENDLTEKLREFIDKETDKLHDENATEAIEKVRQGQVDVDKLAEAWEKAYKQEVKVFAKPEEVSAEQQFSEVYHSLIHSPALETLLNLEHTYALTIEDLIQQRDQDLQHLNESQQEEMQEATGKSYTDEQINTMTQRNIDNYNMIESKWTNELTNQQEIQRREYRDWVMKVHEDTKGSNTPKYMQRVRAMTSNLPEAEEEERHAQIRMEESFTIILGAQMKTTHNLRLLSASILDLCRHKPHTVGGVMVAQPQRLQTAMSLYSKNLCGMIMLVDNRLNTYSGLKKEFAKVCERSTDFHFPNLEKQFTKIEEELKTAWETRRKVAEDNDKVSLKSTGSASSGDTQEKSLKLFTGDFYLTKHSNLSEVHTVFHLVTDDSLRFDVTSRHAVILALRNIIKLCCRYDITTLTIPLLLTHEMSEEMTIPWCMKRSELVFKCVKGFMMEMATYGGAEALTIQFLVPLGISEELFSGISNMLPTIFRLSNPVMAKSS